MAIAETNYQPQEGLLKRIMKRIRRKKEIKDFLMESPDINPRSRYLVEGMRKQGASDDEIVKMMDQEIRKKYEAWKKSRGSR